MTKSGKTDEATKFLIDTYSAEELREQAQVHNRYVQHLKLPNKRSKEMMVAVPKRSTAGAGFTKKIATSLTRIDGLFARLTNKHVDPSKNWAALLSEARTRGADISEATTLRQIKKTILKEEESESESGSYDWEAAWRDGDDDDDNGEDIDKEGGHGMGKDKDTDMRALLGELTKAVTALAKRQGTSEDAVVQLKGMANRMATLANGNGSSGVAGDDAMVMQDGQPAGALGLLKTWEEKGSTVYDRTRKFREHVRHQKWYKQEQVPSDGSDEVRRMNDYIDREEKVERQVMRAQEAVEAEADNERLQTILECAVKQWVDILEDMYMSYQVWVQKKVDKKTAKHMWDVFNEKKYETREDAQFLALKQKAEKRAKKQRAVERDDMAVMATRGRTGRSRGDGAEDSDRDGGRWDDSDGAGSDNRPRWQPTRGADDVFRDCPEEMQGKYVAVGPGEDLFTEPLLRRGYREKTRKRGRGKCTLCKARGHQVWQCTAKEYQRDGKTFIAPLQLYKDDLVDGYGRVKEQASADADGADGDYF